MEPGTQLTHYLVEEKIGEGGMGEVWRAKDTRLQRDVAIKILPTEFASDQERLTRFEREAKALAALNHPHIAQIFGVDQVGDVCFLVLEMVPGETLADRIEKGALPVEEALDVARQIAEGLEAAHDHGIIHRDLKPANVRITPEGSVKILDFGLAKASGKDVETGETLPLDSDSLPLTSEGKVLGTPTYMSPEQARGKAIDRRTDIWAFGCMLFESLTGKRTFTGETITDVLGAIVHMEPDWEALPPRVPTRVRELLRRCLSKDAHHRQRDIGDARVELEEILADPTATMGVAPVGGAGGVRKGPLAVIVLVVAGLAAGATWFAVQAMQPEAKVRRFRIAPDELNLNLSASFKISPDGTRLLYKAAGKLWIRELDTLEPRELADGDGVRHMFWSPDGASVGFVDDTKVWRMPSDGGPRAAIVALPSSLSNVGAVTWLDDDTIVWGTGRTGEPLHWVPAGGGDPRELVVPSAERGEDDFHQPSALPGAAGVLVALHRSDEGDADTLAVVTPRGEDVIQLYTVEGDDSIQSPCYSRTGHVLFRRSGANSGIWALPFALSDLAATGDPFLVVPEGFLPTVSDDGTLVHSESGSSGEWSLVWIERDGRVADAVGDPITGQAFGPVLSPDGSRVTVTQIEEDDFTIWAYDVASGARTRIWLEQDGFAWAGAWMPEGDRVVATHGDFPDVSLSLIAADGSATRTPIGEGDTVQTVTPDGAAVVTERVSDDQNFFIVPIDEGGEGTPFLDGPGYKENVQLSPDGRFAAYESDESSSDEVYVTRFPSGSGKWLLYEKDADIPMWSPMGDEIFFHSDNVLMVVPVSTGGGGVSIGLAKPITPGEVTGLQLWRGFAVAPDGQRVLGVQAADPGRGADRGLVLVENWVAEFSGR